MISNEKADHPWKTLVLENEYIKLCVTPEIGGKLYYGTDKTNGANFIYKNNVLSKSPIQMVYELSNTPIERRSKLFESSNGIVKKRL